MSPAAREDLNQTLEKAGRVADFLELGELMCQDALDRRESCGGHFREEFQTKDGEALRDDEQLCPRSSLGVRPAKTRGPIAPRRTARSMRTCTWPRAAISKDEEALSQRVPERDHGEILGATARKQKENALAIGELGNKFGSSYTEGMAGAGGPLVCSGSSSAPSQRSTSMLRVTLNGGSNQEYDHHRSRQRQEQPRSSLTEI